MLEVTDISHQSMKPASWLLRDWLQHSIRRPDMNVIPTDEVMRHLRAEEDDRADVELYLAAAEDSAAQFMNRRFFTDQTAMDAAIADGSAGDRPILINPTIRAACLLIVGNLYGNREDVVVGTISSELPGGSRSLLMPYRIGWGV